MGMRVNTNVTALKAQTALGGIKKSMDRTMGRLSSGSRIEKAADDAVGLALSENFKSQLRGLKQSHRNAMDGVSLIQISEGGLNEISNMLVRLRELAIQSASDTVGERERRYVDIEYAQLLAEIDRIAESTEFNGTKLLAGVGDQIDLQINTRNADHIDRISYDLSRADAGTMALGVDSSGVLTKEMAQDSLDKIDGALDHVSGLRANLGAIQSQLNSIVQNINESVESVSTANSRIRDADMAEESAEFAKYNILMQSGTAMLTQANQHSQLALQLLGKG